MIDDIRTRLEEDWTELRPVKQAMFVISWTVTLLGLVWLVPRGIFPVPPSWVYQAQVLVTVLVAGAFAEPTHSALQYESIEAWEAAVLGVGVEEWTNHLERDDA